MIEINLLLTEIIDNNLWINKISMDNSEIFNLTAPATARWKKDSINATHISFNLANHRIIRQMVSTQDASKFLNSSVTQGDETQRVSKIEELKEVSSQLVFLRKRHDRNKADNGVYDNVLEKLKKELEQTEKMEARTGLKLDTMKEKAKEMEDRLREFKKKQDDAEMTRKAYEHIIERMKMTKINLEKRSLSLNKSLKNGQQTLREELDKQRRTREAKIQTKEALKNLEAYASREKSEKQEKLDIIEKDVKQKQETSRKREERFYRQLEIAEAAANEDRNMRALQMREGLLCHRLWFIYLQKKLKYEMERSSSIEEAFQQVRSITGLNDAQEMVEKYLTREQIYGDLMETINDSKQKIADYIQRNDEILEKINSLEMTKLEGNNPAKQMSQEATKSFQEISVEKDRLRRIRSVYENIKIWAGKNLRKLGGKPVNPDSKLIDQVITIKDKVKEALKRIKENNQTIISPNVAYPKNLTDLLPEKNLYRIRLLSSDLNQTEEDEGKLMQSLAQNNETPDIIARSQKSALANKP
ncbi:unnamed protein product [Blepharisma stoltei]|uniref:Uncharacterized protein n=1 Tax=Blepharisma stoltei TaxID=1481888 RepID=A0AAU9K2G9_9CILI|nr:unnamed protein product [Blepharisma stoltei]